MNDDENLSSTYMHNFSPCCVKRRTNDWQ